MLAIVVNGRSGGACAVVLNIVLVACVSAQLYMYLKQILKSALFASSRFNCILLIVFIVSSTFA